MNTQENRTELNEMDDISSGELVSTNREDTNLKIALEKQRLFQRNFLFFAILVLCGAQYFFFYEAIYHHRDVAKLIGSAPFVISVVILLGAMPTALMLSLLFSVFKAKKPEPEAKGDDYTMLLDHASKLATICRLIK